VTPGAPGKIPGTLAKNRVDRANGIETERRKHVNPVIVILPTWMFPDAREREREREKGW
jgi:hypothetical protein